MGAARDAAARLSRAAAELSGLRVEPSRCGGLQLASA